MRKIIQPCGLHCMKIQHLSVSIGTQDILTDINLHIHDFYLINFHCHLSRFSNIRIK